MTTPHTFTANRCWYLLSKVACGLSQSHKWKFLVLLTPLRVKRTSSVNKMLRIIWGLELIQRHNSNRLHMSAGSRCRMRWMWYGCVLSVCNVHQTLGVEVSSSGLNSRAHSESQMPCCIRTLGSDLQRLLSWQQFSAADVRRVGLLMLQGQECFR